MSISQNPNKQTWTAAQHNHTKQGKLEVNSNKSLSNSIYEINISKMYGSCFYNQCFTCPSFYEKFKYHITVSRHIHYQLKRNSTRYRTISFIGSTITDQTYFSDLHKVNGSSSMSMSRSRFFNLNLNRCRDLADLNLGQAYSVQTNILFLIS